MFTVTYRGYDFVEGRSYVIYGKSLTGKSRFAFEMILDASKVGQKINYIEIEPDLSSIGPLSRKENSNLDAGSAKNGKIKLDFQDQFASKVFFQNLVWANTVLRYKDPAFSDAKKSYDFEEVMAGEIKSECIRYLGKLPLPDNEIPSHEIVIIDTLTSESVHPRFPGHKPSAKDSEESIVKKWSNILQERGNIIIIMSPCWNTPDPEAKDVPIIRGDVNIPIAAILQLYHRYFTCHH